MYCKEAWMDMQNRIPTPGDILQMDMAYQLDRRDTQDMEKEMEPKFKVGDKVVTKKGVFSEVISITEDWVQTRSFRTGLTFLWSKRHDRKLRFANIYDEAGERWRVTCALKRLAGRMNRPTEGLSTDLSPQKMAECIKAMEKYAQEGYKNSTPDALKRKRFGNIDYFSTMEESIRETYPAAQTPAQPIFRLKRNDGTNGWEGCHFVLVAEDEREMLVREVDINEAKVRDRIVTAQKDTWTRDYSIGDEIINFLQARGGNFINKVVDNG